MLGFSLLHYTWCTHHVYSFLLKFLHHKIRPHTNTLKSIIQRWHIVFNSRLLESTNASTKWRKFCRFNILWTRQNSPSYVIVYVDLHAYAYIAVRSCFKFFDQVVCYWYIKISRCSVLIWHSLINSSFHKMQFIVWLLRKWYVQTYHVLSILCWNVPSTW